MVVFYARIKMLTSKLYSRSAIRHRFPIFLSFRFYWRRLIGTAGAWFLYDFITFPNGIFSGVIISNAIGSSTVSNLGRVAEWQLLLSTIAIPGVFIGALLCNPLGRKWTMMLGFSGYIVFGLIIGCAYNQVVNIFPLFVVFYGLMLSCGNLGPGNYLGLLSTELYSTPVRGTFYGISAAIGKCGAVAGTQSFTAIQNNVGKNWTFIIAAICGVVGILVVFLCIPDVRGEDLAEEDDRFREFLLAHGWTGKMGLSNGETFAVIGDRKDTAD